MSVFWTVVGGFLGGVLVTKIVSAITQGRKIHQIEKKQLHWVLTDKIIREKETITMRDGKALQAYIYSSDNLPEKAPSVLFFHGMGGFAQDFNFEPMLSSLCLAGYRVFAYDYRASGSSRAPGESSIFGSLSPKFMLDIFQDANEAFEWMYAHAGVDQNHIAVMGASLGGNIVLTSLLHELRIKKIVAVCAPHDFGGVIEREFLHGSFLNRLLIKFMTRKANLDIEELIKVSRELSPISHIRPDFDYSKRVFLGHCEDDEIISFTHNFLPNQDQMKIPVENVIVFDRGGHEFKGMDSALFCRVISWLRENLN